MYTFVHKKWNSVLLEYPVIQVQNQSEFRKVKINRSKMNIKK